MYCQITNKKSNIGEEMKTIMCFGTFDILHLGHLNYFQQAKELGDYLIVIISRDKNVKKKSIFNENERLELVNHLDLVDEVVLGDLVDKFKIIREKKPRIILLGYDHNIDEQLLEKEFPNSIVKRAKPFHSEKYKSSKVKESQSNNV
jgi:cytidyltransferase-like protein